MPSQAPLCSGLEKYRLQAARLGTLNTALGLGTWSLAAISDTRVGHSMELGDREHWALGTGGRI